MNVAAKINHLESTDQVLRAGKGEEISRLISRTVFLALLALIVLVSIPYGTVEPLWVAVFECSIFSLTALWIIEGLIAGSWRVKNISLLLPLFSLVVYAYLQTLPLGGNVSQSGLVNAPIWNAFSADPFETRHFAVKLLSLTLALMLLMRYTSSRRRLSTLIWVVIAVAVLSALFGLVRQTTHQGSQGFILPRLRAGSGYGQFINKNHFAFLMEMGLGVVLGLVAAASVRKDRLLIYIAVAFPLWTALILSNSRGGLLGMLSQLVFLVLLLPIVHPKLREGDGAGSTLYLVWRLSRTVVVRIILIICLVATVLLSMAWIGGDPLLSRLEMLPGELQTGSDDGASRMDIWRSSWQMVKDHPVVGTGLGAYWVAIAQYQNGSGKRVPQQAHNDYLELWASGGLLGLLIGAWFVVVFIRRARTTLLSKDGFRRAACYGALLGLFGVMIHSLVDFGLHVTINALVFTALIAIATTDERVEDDKDPKANSLQQRMAALAS